MKYHSAFRMTKWILVIFAILFTPDAYCSDDDAFNITTDYIYSPHWNTTVELGADNKDPSLLSRKKRSSFEEEFVIAHNRYRRRHGVPPLVLDQKMNRYAQDWATKLGTENKFYHREYSPYGESLYYISGVSIMAETLVEKWYSEIQQYNFDNPDYNTKSGHFTQMIWRDSRRLGVGMFRKHGATWIVANYYPPGNFIGQFAQNVPRPLH